MSKQKVWFITGAGVADLKSQIAAERDLSTSLGFDEPRARAI
jgi:hypothetical protein